MTSLVLLISISPSWTDLITLVPIQVVPIRTVLTLMVLTLIAVETVLMDTISIQQDIHRTDTLRTGRVVSTFDTVLLTFVTFAIESVAEVCAGAVVYAV